MLVSIAMAIQTTHEHNLILQRDRLLGDIRALTRGNLMRGSVSTVGRRCGNPRCVCATEGRKHMGRYFSVNMGGKTKLAYVSAEQEPEVTKAIAAYRRLGEFVDELTEVNMKLLKLQRRAERAGNKT